MASQFLFNALHYQASANQIRIAVVIPCFRVRNHVLGVIASIGSEVHSIYCVDDACPDGVGDLIDAACDDPRVRVIRHSTNMGVGGAVMSGYEAAIEDGATIIVKIDGDGQMDPALLSLFIEPILRGDADYTKGNRFWDLRAITRMPLMRRIGNLGLSFMTKASSGYWDIFDPTNGYTAIHARVAERLPYRSISKRYFFETDILFRLNTIRAAVLDIPMDAKYEDEKSNLKISKVLVEFFWKHTRNGVKRIFYNYFLRDFSVASIELIAGVALTLFAVFFGGYHWVKSASVGGVTAVGTIMIATVAAISGLQFLLAFIGYDVANVPRRAIHKALLKVT
jgi:dolichol-phosphate mannosyltransferase